MSVVRTSLRRATKHLALGLFANSLALHAKLQIISAAKPLTILCLHRVAEPSHNSYGALSPELFDELLGWLKSRFNIITFAGLGRQDTDPRPLLTLSFDDGYSDFYEIAMPILGRHGLKVNQNVIPGCIESGLPPINVMVQDFLMSAPEKLLSEVKFPGHLAGFSHPDRARLALRMSATLKAKPMVEQQQILADLTPLFDRFDDFRTTPMMTRAQVAEIAGVHEIGAHSWEHASMSVESNDYVVEDARRCREYLADLGTTYPFVYAFPNGMLRKEQVDAVRAAGFDHVLCVGENFSQPENWLHNRFTFYGDTVAETRFRALGSLRYPLKP